MKTGPKYKLCKRLGSAIFEKCQTKTYALSEARTSGQRRKRGGPRTDFATQHLEKQKMRFTYGLSEKQFSRYVEGAVERKSGSAAVELLKAVESRLDNVIYRLGFASTRALARQLVAHGHITVAGKRVTIPSYAVAPGQEVGIREGSKGKGVLRLCRAIWRLQHVHAPQLTCYDDMQAYSSPSAKLPLHWQLFPLFCLLRQWYVPS